MAKLINTSSENQLFYAWDGLAEKWLIDENQFDTDFPPQPQDPGTSLATHIIQDVFGLTVDNGEQEIGSYLPGYDVVNREAYQMVQLSLTAELVDDKLYECYADGYGIVRFYLIGENTSNIDSDILYSFSQATWKQKCDNVLVFGYDPPEKRIIRGEGGSTTKGYNLFELSNGISKNTIDPQLADDDIGKYPIYRVTGNYLNYEACPRYREGYIEYSNMALGDNKYLDQLGVYHYKEFESIDGYMYKIQVPFFEQGSTQVEFRQKTLRYYSLDGFGKLIVRQWSSNLIYTPAVCNDGQVPDESVGVILPRSGEKKFTGVQSVYIMGYALKQIECDEVIDDNTKTSKAGPADFIVDLDTTKVEPFKLNEGEDYLVIKNGKSDDYRIVFSCNVNPNYSEKLGKKFRDVAKCKYRISRTSIFEFKSGGGAGSQPIPSLPTCVGGKYSIDACDGTLRDGQTDISDHKVLEDVIFPTGDGITGYVVKRLIAVYEWDNPCVAIFDQKNNVTLENLKDVKMEIFPVIVKNPPQWVARNGMALDPSQQLPDLDAKTVEDLYSKDYQMAMSSMENADVRVTLPFLDQDGCNKVSAKIKELQTQVVEVTTNVCDPNAEPVLGELIDGKTINSIDYSYQDSSQYMINVQAGPVWQGMTSWDNSLYQNGTERIQLEGIVRFVYENNTRIVVQLEQLGLMECVNGQQQVLEAGDTVKVTVYNNPVRR